MVGPEPTDRLRLKFSRGSTAPHPSPPPARGATLKRSALLIAFQLVLDDDFVIASDRPCC